MNSDKKLGAILESIAAIEGEIRALEEMGPSAEERVNLFNSAVDQHAAKQLSFEVDGDRENVNELLSTRLSDPASQFSAFISYFFGDQLKARFAELVDTLPASLSQTEKKRKRAELEENLSAAWESYETRAQAIEADTGMSLDRDPREPAQIYLRWDEKTRTLDHSKFARLHQISEQNRATSWSAQQQLESIRQEKNELEQRHRAALAIPSTPKSQIEEIEAAILCCEEKQTALGLQRKQDAVRNKAAAALHTGCCEFLREKGIDANSSEFLLLGKSSRPRPFIDPMREGLKAQQARSAERRAQ